MQDDSTEYFLGFDDKQGWDKFQRREYGDTFGFKANAKARAEKLPIGSVLVCYITGQSKWCGILRVKPGIFVAAEDNNDYPKDYPVRVPIERVLVLPTYKAIWIHEEEIWNGLLCTRGIDPKSRWTSRAGLRRDLARLQPEDGKFLVQKISDRESSPLVADAANTDDSDLGDFDPKSEADARERQERSIVARRGQKAFRDKLIKAYEGKCAISGCDVRAVLEAAHVTPYLGPNTNCTANGLLLRADLHTLWDCGLLAADPKTREVIVDKCLLQSDYAAFAHKQLRRTSPPSSAPSKEALQGHLDNVFSRRARDTM